MRLGLWPSTALIVGHTIAVGIFLTPAELIGALGSPALTLGFWLGGGALVFAGALSFGELATLYPESGGLYVYLREAFGKGAAFLYGWQALLIMDPGITAALAVGLAQYFVAAWPAAAGHERAIALVAIWATAMANMAGLRVSARLLGALTIMKLVALGLIVLTAFGLGAGNWSHLVPFAARRDGAPPLGNALAAGLVGLFFSFGGFWEASRMAGEIRDPRRTLPRALALGVAIVTLAYAATTLAFLYLVPSSEATTATTFARSAGFALFGGPGPAILASIIVVSVIGSAMALLMMAPRLYVAMSRDGLFPATLAALHPSTNTPIRATALLAAIASALALSGSFQQIVAFFLCTALAFVALAAAGLFLVRRKRPATAGFRTPGYPATPAIFIGFLVAVIGCVTLARPFQALAGFALVLLGLPAYRLLCSRRAAAAPEGGFQR